LRKVLYADDIRPGAGGEELLHSKEEVAQTLQQYGVRFAVVSQNLAIRFDSQRILREQLRGDAFTVLERYPVTTNEPRWSGENLLL
jgi:hypothetical protein